MKTTLKRNIFAVAAALFAIAITSASGSQDSGSASSTGWFKRNFGSLSWDEVVSVVQSPRDASFQVKMHVRYRATDGWSTGKDAWTRGYGDCKDFAACVKDLCARKGFKSIIYVFHKTTGKDRFQGHAVVIGKWNDEIWISSNGYWYSAKSFHEAKKQVVAGLGWKAEDTIVTPLRDVTCLLASKVPERK